MGAKAVYEPERYPQAGDPNADVRLGVIDLLHKGHTKWMDVGETGHSHLIARAGWMPDSAHVYVERLTRTQNLLELISYSVHTGAGSVMLHESDLYWVNLHGEPKFLMSGQFLWLSERDGFTHLYLCSPDGKEQTQLTKGQWEVASVVGVNEAAGRVYFLSSEVSPLERQLYSIGLDGRNKTRLSKAGGTHAISMGPGAHYYLDTVSSLSAPPHTTLHKGRRKRTGLVSRGRYAAAGPVPSCPRGICKVSIGRPAVLRETAQACRLRSGEKVSGGRAGLRRSRRAADCGPMERREPGTDVRAGGLRDLGTG